MSIVQVCCYETYFHKISTDQYILGLTQLGQAKVALDNGALYHGGVRRDGGFIMCVAPINAVFERVLNMIPDRTYLQGHTCSQ